MSHTRTVRQFVQEVEHATGIQVRIRWIFYRGVYRGTYLEDSETGAQYMLGWVSRYHLLSPEEQESICRGLHRQHWIVLLGLNPTPDDD